MVIDICLSSHFRKFSCCVGLSYFTFCIYGTGWHIHHPFLIPYLKPEFSRLRICDSDAQKYKKKDTKYITNVAQQSDNTVVETWYGRRQESKAKTLPGSRLKIELRLDFLKIEVRLFFFENRSPIRFFFENRSRVRYFFSLYNLLSARRLYMNLE